MEIGQEYISTSVVLSRLNRILENVYCDELKKSLLFTQHATDLINQDGFGNTDNKQLHDLVELIFASDNISDQMRLICSIADPYLLLAFDRTIKRSISLIKEKVFFTNVPESNSNFVKKFALLALEDKMEDLPFMKEAV